MLKGIDVSEHQGRINWEQVKDHVDFVMLRAGYGRNNIDKQFIRNIEECNRLGIPVGIYWFSYAWNEEMARNEAKYVLEAIKGYRVDYPISFDLEYDTLNYAKKNGVTIGKRLATDMINAFCSTIEQAGYKAMNYANPDFINNKFYNNEVNYPLWLAWYGVSEDRAKAYNPSMWQYSESGSIPGIGTNSVDMNYCYEDFLKKDFTLENATTCNVDTELNIRAKGNTSSNIVGKIPAGERFRIKWVDSDYLGWYYIEYQGVTGYVSQDYVKKLQMATTCNVDSVLNVRAEGNTSSNIVATINSREIFRIDWVDSDFIGWYRITTATGATGFVKSDFVKKV
ncbi:GH25 family lysozyme [Clostridium perfringens]|uniref:GH25 family lysozyme n=1 Tax=Clostridium perfringens TaxID=1502 RepID=UPI00110749DE|nr:GH25 family lysozyme [Clostridium perfringens]MDK0610383.1 GH25 family lysozyme [Clostridium perfringens]MDK0675334.1 GH25 family lysozyme [Clostridium perfringens]MDM0758047.1 GH25 family lysozyme [Clostridium perfringens]MDM0760989.1 GH25 family lysozyme [Clostridium perfringens]